MLLCKINNLIHFCGGDILGKYAAHTHTLSMHFEHNLDSPFSVHRKKFLHDVHDKLHWRVIVIQKHHLV